MRTLTTISLILVMASIAWAADYRSPCAVAVDKAGATLYVAEDAGAIAVVDMASGKVKQRIALPGPCTGVAVRDDDNLYATAGVSPGVACLVNVSSGKVTAMPAGHTPMSPVVSPDGARLYVCNRFNNDVSVFDTGKGAELKRVPVVREPVAAAVTPDGKKLYVTNLLPSGASDGNFAAAEVSVIDTATLVASNIMLPNGSTGTRGVCVSPDGAYVYVTHILARYQMPTTQLERGWMNTNALSIIGTSDDKLVNTVLLDEVELGAANPWGVACSADGKYLCVTHAGTHEISVIDRQALHDKLKRAAAGERVTDVTSNAAEVPNDLSFIVDVRRRVKLAGNGPRGIAMAGAKAYAAEFFSDSVGCVDAAAAVAKASEMPLQAAVEQTPARRGEMLFNDATMCFQQWQSCASCHPDVRSDCINWDLLNDGIGNPKNTHTMLLTHQTPPVMSLGVRKNAEIAVRAGMKFIQFVVRPEEDAVALDEFLKSLKPVPSPHLINGQMGPAAERGKELFNRAGCAACHAGPLFTDLQKYDIGTGKDMDAGKEFDTPSLLEVWRTAPYLHDGRAATMLDVISTFNPDDKHGETSKMSDQEKQDLAEYLLTL